MLFQGNQSLKKKKKIKLIKENLLGSWLWKAQRTYFLKPIFENLLRKQFVKHLLKTSSKGPFGHSFQKLLFKKNVKTVV